MNVRSCKVLLHMANFVVCWKCHQPLSTESQHSCWKRLKSIPDIAENDVHEFSLLTRYLLFHDFWTFVWSIDKKIYRELEHPALVFIHIWFHGHLHYNHIFLPHWKSLMTIHVIYKAARTFMVVWKPRLENCRTGIPFWVSVMGFLWPDYE